MIEYAEEVSQWEDWQQAFRFGVLLVYPPEPLRSVVNSLREEFDPKSQSICDAHISLTVPFPRPLSQGDWEELRQVTEASGAIEVTYGPLANYLPHPGVVLSIEPQDELDQLRAALEDTSSFQGASPRSHPFSAHMTIAEFITVERTEELMRELMDRAPTGRFRCDAVSLAVPDRRFRFEERTRLALAH